MGKTFGIPSDHTLKGGPDPTSLLHRDQGLDPVPADDLITGIAEYPATRLIDKCNPRGDIQGHDDVARDVEIIDRSMLGANVLPVGVSADVA